eukprot:345901_1
MMTLFVDLYLLSICASEWIQQTVQPLPRPTYYFAIGVHKNRIIMIGGSPASTNGRQLFQYDITTNVFIDNGTSALSQEISCYGCGIFYTQIQNILYIMDGLTINTYNLQSNNFITNVTNTIIPINTGSCLTSSTNYLFITGGG